MKKILFVICLATLLSASCASDKHQVKSAAQHYLDATGDYNIDEACKYATPETVKGLRTIEKTVMRMVDPEYIKKNTPAKITIKDIIYTNDSVARVAFHKKTPIQEVDDTLMMVRYNGEWKAQIKIKVPDILAGDESTVIDSDQKAVTKFNYDTITTLEVGDPNKKRDNKNIIK
ncbi:MAG: DUF4878 domain-containing protein [Bacteroidales bacterium]|nr:DUF4878 domain-containing protein [Bacteroidales bacterium]